MIDQQLHIFFTKKKLHLCLRVNK